MPRQHIVHPQELYHGRVDVRNQVTPCIPLETLELIFENQPS